MPQLVDGVGERELAARLRVPRVALFASVTSTMDEAHRLAEAGADAGTVVVADEQLVGRGRGGRRWSSHRAFGVWMTVLERPENASGLDVLSLRTGLHLARALDVLAGRAVQVKWPNDLYEGERKLAGILIEARWREQRPDWVAIGIGINLVAPSDVPLATGLRPGATRLDVLACAVPAVRAAAAVRGPLTFQELAEFDDRDFARGRRCAVPAAGVAKGITRDGELIIESEGGVAHYRGSSLEFAGEAQ